MAADNFRFYITAAIDYVNGAPHLGHAYEKIGCDLVARHHRMRGREVRFTVGTDEHSQSVERAAAERGMPPAEFAAQQAEVFRAFFDALDISYTAMVRTESDANRRTSLHLWDRLVNAGQLYKGMYQAWFCPSCEAYYTEKQLVDSLCPIHHRAVEWVEEENWFFRLSAHQQALLDHYAAHPEFLTPEPRRNEILNVIRGGLEDTSVSRAFSTWGIPVPGDPGQVIYVWIDALPAYLTGAGYPDGEDFARFWPADAHVIGKDITRFHAILWPAMLMAAGIELPRRVHAHGFLTLGGEKMSKTRGVFVDPTALVEQFGSDAVRYVLTAEVPFDRDGDFSMEVFVDRYNADLANDYGNLVSRTTKMVDRYYAGKVPQPGPRQPIDDELRTLAAEVVPAYDAAIEDLDLSGALSQARRLVGRANKFIEETAPWTLSKAGDPRLGTVICEVLEALRVSTLLMAPAIPRAAGRVAADLGINLDATAADGVRAWGVLKPGDPVKVGDILFPRLDRLAVLGGD
jgi:methionyl-tRNA synthetase